MKISQNGEILREISVFDLLIDNNLKGLLYLSTLKNGVTTVTGDTLHLNDVETFPSSLSEGVFKHGDVMISLRNINAILVFNPEDMRIRFLSIGNVLRQHDPDFLDGNTISVFDNKNLFPDNDGEYSKIVELSALEGSVTEHFTGSEKLPFFANIMGKHQLLSTGNLLITEAPLGRAFEISPEGKLLWEYYNIVDDGIVGLLDEAQRLPVEFDASFFTRAASACN